MGSDPATDKAPPKVKALHIWLIAVLSLIAALSTCAASMLTTTYGAVGKDLGMPEVQRIWLLTSSACAMAALFLVFGRLSDIANPKNVLLGGLVVFSVASAFLGLVRNAPFFIALRALQGGAAAAMAPSGIAILGKTIPEGLPRNIALGLHTGFSALAFSGGIFLGSLMVHDWKWIFYNVALVGFIILPIAYFVMRPLRFEHEESSHSLDYFGNLLAIVSIVSITYSLPRLEHIKAEPHVAVLLAVAIVATPAFFYWESRAAHPLLNYKLWGYPNVKSIIINTMLVLLAYEQSLLLCLDEYEKVRHYDQYGRTLRILPFTVGGFVASLVVGYITGRVPYPKITISASLLMLIASLFFVIFARADSPWGATFLPFQIVASFAFQLYTNASYVTLLHDVPASAHGTISSLYSVAVQLGVAFMTLTTSLRHAYMKRDHADDTRAEYKFGYLLNLGLFAIPFLITMLTVGHWRRQPASPFTPPSDQEKASRLDQEHFSLKDHVEPKIKNPTTNVSPVIE